ncbi:glutamate receptor 2.5-like [Ipomoea triloba]|uniref:glutamate receptor 2.5-like n=1 Tax=Ipomoea triloba TaxID=35885 RepID=UPI00125D68E1|nr:glutamate receptor 2.5-like [Ipomoea triloba]
MAFSILSFPLLFLLPFGLLLIPWCSNAQEKFASAGNSSVTFQVGVVLDLDTDLGRRGIACLYMAHSVFYSVHSKYKTRLDLHVRDSKKNVIDAAAASLHLLKEIKVDAIIGPQKSAQASFVSDLGDRAQVPIISFSATNPSLHHRAPYFIQTAQSDDMEVAAVAAIVKAFKWSQVVIICEDSEYGNGIVHYLSNELQSINARVSGRSVIPLSATDDFILKELYKLVASQTRVFVVHMSHSLGAKLFSEAKKIGMMSDGYAWIITSGLTDLFYLMNSDVRKAMQGVLGVKPLIPKTKRLESFVAGLRKEFFDSNDFKVAEVMSIFDIWAYDTMWALAMAAERVGSKEPQMVSNSPADLNSSDPFHIDISLTGPKLLKAIQNTHFEGLAGNFSLKDGRLKPSSYQILNMVEDGEREVGIWNPNLGITSGTNATLKDVVWPGESAVVPRGWEIPAMGKRLKIALAARPGFPEYINVVRDAQTNSFRFGGYYIDVFSRVMASLPYSVPYDLVPYEKPDGSCPGTYNDLIYDVYSQKYDGAIGDITITANRSQYVDFTLPFDDGGVVSIVPITYEDESGSWTFLKPLKKELWLTSILLFIFTGVAIWILEHRISSAFRGPPSQHVGMMFYFPFSTITFAHRERIVSNLGRLVVVLWMFVVLILNSTYTASLSSMLTAQKLRPATKDVKELIKKGDYVGCFNGSFIFNLLIEMGFEKSKIRTYRYPEDYKDALSDGSKLPRISAFFDVVPYSNLFLSKYCDKYMKVGQTYHTTGFAYVFPKGSPLVANVSRAIIKLTEEGNILDNTRQWLRSDEVCTGPEKTSASTVVALQSFKVLFAIFGGVTGLCLLVFIATYVYKNKDFIQETLSSRTTIWLKIQAIGRHFDQRDLSSHKLERAKDPQEPEGDDSEFTSSHSIEMSNLPRNPPCSRPSSPCALEGNTDEPGNANSSSQHEVANDQPQHR